MLTDQDIDLIAADGMRNAAGGIYATRVYEFARAIEAQLLGFGQMEPSPVNYLRLHAQDLIAQYGSVRKAGDALGIDHTYLYRIAAGEKEWPSDDVLLRMGLERVVTYRKCAARGVREDGRG